MPYKGPTLAELKKRKDQSAYTARIGQLAGSAATRKYVDVPTLERLGYTKQAHQRQLNERLDQTVVPGGQMTNRDLAHQANAATTVQYGAPITLAQRQAATAPDYYRVYAQALQQGAQATQAQGAQSGQAIQSLYGSGPQAPNSPQSTIGAAQGGTAALLGQVGANFLNRTAAAATGEGVQQRNLALQREADLKKEAGQFNVEQRGKLASQELQNVSTAALAGINAQKATTAASQGQQRIDIQKTNAQNRRTQQGQSANDPYLQKYGITRAAFLALSPAERQKLIASTKAKPKGTGAKGPKGPKPTSGPGSLAPGLENKYVGQVDKAAGLLNDGKLPAKNVKGQVVYQPATQGQIIDWLKAHGMDPHIIGIANSLVANNMQGIGKIGVDHAHALGIHVGGRWKIVKGKVRPGSGAPANP